MKTFSHCMGGIVLAALSLIAAACPGAEIQSEGLLTGAPSTFRSIGLGFCAAFTMALCVIGAAYAVARIGSAALGAAAEKPELLTRSIMYVALAEGLAVLGFAIAMMLIQKI